MMPRTKLKLNVWKQGVGGGFYYKQTYALFCMSVYEKMAISLICVLKNK